MMGALEEKSRGQEVMRINPLVTRSICTKCQGNPKTQLNCGTRGVVRDHEGQWDSSSGDHETSIILSVNQRIVEIFQSGLKLWSG